METSESRPDLLATSSRPTQGKRILAQLEHGVRPQAQPARTAWTIDGWTIGLCVLLVLMCSVAWLMHEKRITPESFRHDYRGNTATAARRPAAATPEAAAGTAAPQAAVIISDAPAANDTALQSRPAPATPATRMTATASEHPANAPRKAAARVAATPASAATVSSDTDVALLTALVAHASQPATVSLERSRDVVERQPGDSTAQLLARCKQLGMMEGMLCRSRICSGRWDADAACRAPAH